MKKKNYIYAVKVGNDSNTFSSTTVLWLRLFPKYNQTLFLSKCRAWSASSTPTVSCSVYSLAAQIILQQTANAAAAGLAVAKTLRCNSGASTKNSRSGCPVVADVHCAASCLRCGWLERKVPTGTSAVGVRMCIVWLRRQGQDPAFNQQMRCCPPSHARASISYQFLHRGIFDDTK